MTIHAGSITNITVAIVEDDRRFADNFMAAIDAQADMRVVGCAADVRGGRSLVDSQPIDVLLVDLGLPDARGTELIRYAVERQPRCDVMVVTVFGDEHHVIEALQAGATGYLLKDAAVTDISQEIRTLRAGGSPINPVIARRLLQKFSGVPSAAPRNAAEVAAATDVQQLSDRERTVLSLVAKGFSYDEITSLLMVSRHTVLTYVKRLYGKLQVHSKTEAIYEARKLGLVED